MGVTSERGLFGDFWGFYRAYARTGIHAAAAVAVTVGFGATQFAWWFPVLGLVCYVVPPIYLYATGYTPGSDSNEADTDVASQSSDAEPADAPTVGRSAAGAERIEDRPASGNEAERVGSDETDGWIEADSPVEIGLSSVAIARTGPYAVGEGGVVLARRSDSWKVVLECGPTADSNTLWGTDVTDDGRHVWFAGDSGVLGQYHVGDERLTDYSTPEDRTSTWEDCAVVGRAGEERVFLANGSGEVVRGENHDGSMTWDEGTKPGSGSSIAAIAFAGEYGVLCDTNGAVFETANDGETYEKIGVEDASATFTDIAAVDSETVVVACDDGSVIRYDGEHWTKRHLGDGALAAIDRTANTGLAAGAGGSLYERTAGHWKSVSTPTETDLSSVVIGGDSDGHTERDDSDGLAVSVGAEGTIIER